MLLSMIRQAARAVVTPHGSATWRSLGPTTVMLLTAVALGGCSRQPSLSPALPFVPPKTFDDAAIRSIELPLAVADASPVQISSDTYYRVPIAPIYKSYAVYPPGREPSGYFASLQSRAPEIAFDPATLTTDADWIRAGELVFDAPNGFGSIDPSRADMYLRDRKWYDHVRPSIAADGTLPLLSLRRS